MTEILTEFPCGLRKFSHSDDSANPSITDLIGGWRKTNRSDVVSESNRLIHAQDGNVVG